ncbi:hypothetical protein IV417_11245 [Alphaproteobacteria bacterium KMM 3653]|uniref:Uncharacterized protein n=1 Tax=Harenicola maris TaxID=2841044 RepID=A0AAP2CPZ2_9RHOB|nr:hypothetical protein [Harenicola maris]
MSAFRLALISGALAALVAGVASAVTGQVGGPGNAWAREPATIGWISLGSGAVMFALVMLITRDWWWL